MDSGIVSAYYSVDEAIENGAAPIPLSFDKTIDIQRTIDIMDHVIACEVRHHFFLILLGERMPFLTDVILCCRQHGTGVIHLHKLFSRVSTS